MRRFTKYLIVTPKNNGKSKSARSKKENAFTNAYNHLLDGVRLMVQAGHVTLAEINALPDHERRQIFDDLRGKTDKNQRASQIHNFICFYKVTL